MKSSLHARLTNYVNLISAFNIFQGKKNIVVDGLSWVIFNNPDYSSNQLVDKLAKEVFLYQDDNKWFWKSDKRSYKDMLMQFITEDHAIWIQQYKEEAVLAFLMG